MNIDINVNYPKPVDVSINESIIAEQKKIYDKRRDDLTPRFYFNDEGIYLGNGYYAQMVVSREVLMEAIKEWSKGE